MPRPGKAVCTWSSSSTRLPVASWTGGWAARCAQISCGMHLSSPCTPDSTDGMLICQSNRGSQYVRIRYIGRPTEARIAPCADSKGGSYDPLAETINGLCGAESIHRRTPWKTRKTVESATLEWASWFKQYRQLEGIGHPPRR